jgi:hypothetical protein
MMNKAYSRAMNLFFDLHAARLAGPTDAETYPTLAAALGGVTEGDRTTFPDGSVAIGEDGEPGIHVDESGYTNHAANRARADYEEYCRRGTDSAHPGVPR